MQVPELRHDVEFDKALRRIGFRPAEGSRPDSPGVYRDLPRGRETVADDVWDKRLFVRPDPGQPAILHIRKALSPWGRYTILFRDWLREHPAQRSSYQQTKLALADAHAGDPTMTTTRGPRPTTSTGCRRSSSGMEPTGSAEPRQAYVRQRRPASRAARCTYPTVGSVHFAARGVRQAAKVQSSRDTCRPSGRPRELAFRREPSLRNRGVSLLISGSPQRPAGRLDVQLLGTRLPGPVRTHLYLISSIR